MADPVSRVVQPYFDRFIARVYILPSWSVDRKLDLAESIDAVWSLLAPLCLAVGCILAGGVFMFLGLLSENRIVGIPSSAKFDASGALWLVLILFLVWYVHSLFRMWMDLLYRAANILNAEPEDFANVW